MTTSHSTPALFPSSNALNASSPLPTLPQASITLASDALSGAGADLRSMCRHSDSAEFQFPSRLHAARTTLAQNVFGRMPRSFCALLYSARTSRDVYSSAGADDITRSAVARQSTSTGVPFAHASSNVRTAEA